MIFKQMYEFTRYGYSAALSFILFIVILSLTIVQTASLEAAWCILIPQDL